MVEREIQAERDAQTWSAESDARWSPAEWAALISHYATRHVVGDLGAIDKAAFRSDVVKVGALALACIEAIDRGA